MSKTSKLLFPTTCLPLSQILVVSSRENFELDKKHAGTAGENNGKSTGQIT
jgi:hypothetical protein